MAAWALKTPAQPHALSFIPLECGAESVPRKTRGLPEVAARMSASWSTRVLRMGRPAGGRTAEWVSVGLGGPSLGSGPTQRREAEAGAHSKSAA